MGANDRWDYALMASAKRLVPLSWESMIVRGHRLPILLMIIILKGFYLKTRYFILHLKYVSLHGN